MEHFTGRSRCVHSILTQPVDDCQRLRAKTVQYTLTDGLARLGIPSLEKIEVLQKGWPKRADIYHGLACKNLSTAPRVRRNMRGGLMLLSLYHEKMVLDNAQ